MARVISLELLRLTSSSNHNPWFHA